MKQYSLAIISTAFILSVQTPAQAQQATSFTGAAVALGLGITQNKANYGDFQGGKNSSKTDALGKLDLSYGFNLSSNWVATLGATHDLNTTKYGSMNYIDSGRSYEVSGKLKNHASLYLAPGYRFTPSLLGYAKLGWHTATIDLNDSQGGSISSSFNGTGYGLGLNAALSQHLEARVEVEQVDFNRKESFKLRTTQALIYLGYRF